MEEETGTNITACSAWELGWSKAMPPEIVKKKILDGTISKSCLSDTAISGKFKEEELRELEA